MSPLFYRRLLDACTFSACESVALLRLHRHMEAGFSLGLVQAEGQFIKQKCVHLTVSIHSKACSGQGEKWVSSYLIL